MGILEDIDALELADDVKENLKRNAQAEIDAERTQTQEERRKNRRTSVEDEIKGLQTMFSDKDGNVSPEMIGVLKYTRRVYLSDDEEPGVVLLTDDELELSDDQRTGARQKEEVSTADVVRHLFSLFPKNDEGKISLSDVIPENPNNDRPDNGTPESEVEKNKAATQRLGWSGERKRTRYSRDARTAAAAAAAASGGGK